MDSSRQPAAPSEDLGVNRLKQAQASCHATLQTLANRDEVKTVRPFQHKLLCVERLEAGGVPYRHEALHMPWNSTDVPAWTAHQRPTTSSFLKVLQLAAVVGSRTLQTGWSGPTPRSPRQGSQTSSAGFKGFPRSLKRTA